MSDKVFGQRPDGSHLLNNGKPEEPTAAYILETYQEQLDSHGTHVGVSRQALDEVLESYKQLEKEAQEYRDFYYSCCKERKIQKATIIKLAEKLKEAACWISDLNSVEADKYRQLADKFK